jgi:hypothetical protein
LVFILHFSHPLFVLDALTKVTKPRT